MIFLLFNIFYVLNFPLYLFFFLNLREINPKDKYILTKIKLLNA